MLQSILSFLAPSLFLATGIFVVLTVSLVLSWIANLRRGNTPFKASRKMELWKWAKDGENRVSLIINGLAVILALFGFIILWMTKTWVGLAPELVSTAVAISFIDWLVDYRGEQREKRRAISQMSAFDSNDVALAGLAVLRAEGWHKDGTLHGASLENANLQNADLWDASLQTISLSGAKLDRAFLMGVNLQGANLSGTKLESAFLINANLQDASLRGAKMEYAFLTGANLKNADLRDANLQNTYYDSSTVWPDGFDPVAAGCKLIMG